MINNRNNVNTDDTRLSVLENIEINDYAGVRGTRSDGCLIEVFLISQYTPEQAKIAKRLILNKIHNTSTPPLEEKSRLEECLRTINCILDRDHEVHKLSNPSRLWKSGFVVPGL